MDRRVKERLVGAGILALLMVLIVPELLSGPHAPRRLAGAAEPVRNVTVDLATSKATPVGETGTASTAGSLDEATPGLSDAPAPANDVPSQNHRAGAPTVATLPQQPSSAADKASPPNASLSLPKAVATRPVMDNAHRNWAVQLGSFVSRVNAEKLERRLKTQNFPAFISASGTGKTLRYRVRVGPMADRASAERAFARLRKQGLSASVIPL